MFCFGNDIWWLKFKETKVLLIGKECQGERRIPWKMWCNLIKINGGNPDNLTTEKEQWHHENPPEERMKPWQWIQSQGTMT